MTSDDFYLGTHEVPFFALTDVPLFVSRRRLAKRTSYELEPRAKSGRSFPRARGPWALDSGGYTELHDHGDWTITPGHYAAEVELWQREIGNLRWCAPMDWMCEPSVLANTGLDVEEHQIRTVDNFLRLRDLLGPLVIPVLQGWTLDDYLVCVEMYQQAHVELADEAVVGVGSVCRRNSTTEICTILRRLAGEGLRLHAFGVKGDSYQSIGPLVASADSMAWSFRARKAFLDGDPPVSELCTHRSCANCVRFALSWRIEQLRKAHAQLRLWEEIPCAA